MFSGLLLVFVELGNLHGTSTRVDSKKEVGRSSVKVPKFDKHLKKAGGHIGRNVVEITIKMKTISRKPLMKKLLNLLTSCINIIKNEANLHLEIK